MWDEVRCDKAQLFIWIKLKSIRGLGGGGRDVVAMLTAALSMNHLHEFDKYLWPRMWVNGNLKLGRLDNGRSSREYEYLFIILFVFKVVDWISWATGFVVAAGFHEILKVSDSMGEDLLLSRSSTVLSWWGRVWRIGDVGARVSLVWDINWVSWLSVRAIGSFLGKWGIWVNTELVVIVRLLVLRRRLSLHLRRCILDWGLESASISLSLLGSERTCLVCRRSRQRVLRFGNFFLLYTWNWSWCSFQDRWFFRHAASRCNECFRLLFRNRFGSRWWAIFWAVF